MGFRQTASVFFEYDTPRIVHIKSKRIGVTHRLLQFIIFTYIIGFAIVWQKGYQLTCPVNSAVITKVKGVTYTNLTTEQLIHVPSEYRQLYNRIWDPTDYVIPTSGGEFGGFFVTTNVVITPNQTRGVCAESTTVRDAHCNSDTDCPKGKTQTIGNGVFTGKCVHAPPPRQSTCQVMAWCPVEYDQPAILGKEALLKGAENFTVLIKNAIEFPRFGPIYKRRNILESSNETYLQTCTYDEITDPFCPIFTLGYVVKAAGENFSEIAINGAVFEIEITWDCNLDWDFLQHCIPKYSFERMDKKDALISPGWNFRIAEFHEENRRTLFKNFGIKFLVKVTGQAGKFNLVPLGFNLGSALALMGLATILCDLLVFHCVKNKRYYQGKRYLVVQDVDGFNSLLQDQEDDGGPGATSRDPNNSDTWQSSNNNLIVVNDDDDDFEP